MESHRPVSKPMGTGRPMSALCSRADSDEMKRISSAHPCMGRLGSLFVLGSFLIIIGVIVLGLYINIRALTTSLEFAEVLPTYIPASAMIISGSCLILIFWKRVKFLVIGGLITCVTTSLLNTVAAILTGTHVIQVMLTFTMCRYYSDRQVCFCMSPYSRNKLDLSLQEDLTSYSFESAVDCVSIQGQLQPMVYGICGCYTFTVILCTVAAILCSMILWVDSLKERLPKETYEEVYTVSGGSSISSESDHEQQLTTPALPDARVANESKPPNIGIRRSQSLCQPREKHLEESTDNLLTDTSIESSAAATRVRQKRRRHKRAMTLHNLDSEQLMLILSLQMRYLQESQNLRENQNRTPNLSGAKTPIPSRSKTPSVVNGQPESYPITQTRQANQIVEPNLNHHHGNRVRSHSAMAMQAPHDPGQLPNTRIGVHGLDRNTISDIPRYVSLPKLPRRSQTPQIKQVNGNGGRIPASSSDPNIQGQVALERASKTNMLLQRQGRQPISPQENFNTSAQMATHPVVYPNRVKTAEGNYAHLPGYPGSRTDHQPSRIKTSDGNYVQIAHQRSRTPSNSSGSSGMGSRPLPPPKPSQDAYTARSHGNMSQSHAATRPTHITPRSLERSENYGSRSHDSSRIRPHDRSQIITHDGSRMRPHGSSGIRSYGNPGIRSHDSVGMKSHDKQGSTPHHTSPSNKHSSNNESRPQQPSNYVEVTYATSDHLTNGNVIEGLYACPDRPPQILLNDMSVDLYPVQEKNTHQLSQQQSNQKRPLPPPPYPVCVTSGVANTTRAHKSSCNGNNKSPSGTLSNGYCVTDGENRHCHSPQHYYSSRGGNTHHNSQEEDFPPPPPPPDFPHSGQSHLQREDLPPPPRPLYSLYQMGNSPQLVLPGNLTSETNAFRPITDYDSRQLSPPVRDSSSHQGAFVLHNSDEDSDSEFMETVI